MTSDGFYLNGKKRELDEEGTRSRDSNQDVKGVYRTECKVVRVREERQKRISVG